mgnify:CR=1 FL=1
MARAWAAARRAARRGGCALPKTSLWRCCAHSCMLRPTHSGRTRCAPSWRRHHCPALRRPLPTCPRPLSWPRGPGTRRRHDGGHFSIPDGVHLRPFRSSARALLMTRPPCVPTGVPHRSAQAKARGRRARVSRVRRPRQSRNALRLSEAPRRPREALGKEGQARARARAGECARCRAAGLIYLQFRAPKRMSRGGSYLSTVSSSKTAGPLSTRSRGAPPRPSRPPLPQSLARRRLAAPRAA